MFLTGDRIHIDDSVDPQRILREVLRRRGA
jgi:hypothetical protein